MSRGRGALWSGGLAKGRKLEGGVAVAGCNVCGSWILMGNGAVLN